MNEYQQALYDNLMALVEERDTFYFQDFVLNGNTYRIFNYRLASYTDFLQPGALECRGVMYLVLGDLPLSMVCLPFHKFFNLNENPLTMDLDLSQIHSITLKMDGSLISTYWHSSFDERVHELRLKSKGSIASTQALSAMKWLDGNEKFKDELAELAGHDLIVNMEWCAPDNRIVIGYEEPHLKVLSVRDMWDGSYVPLSVLNDLKELSKHWVEQVDPPNKEQFVRSIPQMTNVEGYVVQTRNAWFKVKTDWYLALHRLKDSINSPRRLFEAVLDEASDDLRASFHDDPLAIKQIGEMEEYATTLYNEMVKTVEAYYEANKHLDRKSYAIKGQQELKRMYFGLAMMKYTDREPNYKDFLKRQWKTLGLKDEVKGNE